VLPNSPIVCHIFLIKTKRGNCPRRSIAENLFYEKTCRCIIAFPAPRLAPPFYGLVHHLGRDQADGQRNSPGAAGAGRPDSPVRE